jgi:hypothetical protein
MVVAFSKVLKLLSTQAKMQAVYTVRSNSIVSTTVTVIEKCMEHQMCFILLYSFAREMFHSDKHLVSYTRDMHRNECASSCRVSVIIILFSSKVRRVNKILITLPKIKFHDNLLRGSRIIIWGAIITRTNRNVRRTSGGHDLAVKRVYYLHVSPGYHRIGSAWTLKSQEGGDQDVNTSTLHRGEMAVNNEISHLGVTLILSYQTTWCHIQEDRDVGTT